MKRKNMATMVTCIALVGAVAVGGTLALLTSNTPEVTNTFTIGNGYPATALTLDEAEATQVVSGKTNFGGYEALNHETRVTKNEYLNVVEGTTLDKDPTFHLADGSPDSWIIAHVTGVNELANKKITIDGVLPEDYGWYKLDTVTYAATSIEDYDELVDGYYVTADTIAGGTSTDDLFEQMLVESGAAGGFDGEMTINISGVAVEAVTGEWGQDGEAVVEQAKTAGFIR